jgi:hypothetical protein
MLTKEQTTGLRQLLSERFSDPDTRLLCFDLGIDIENIRGQTKDERIAELIDYTRRRDMLVELIATGKKLRPDISWPDIPTNEPASRKTDFTELQPSLLITVKQNGTGDFDNIIDAISAIGNVGEIYISSGVYIVDRPISISKTITIIGEGSQKTKLIFQTSTIRQRYGIGFFGEGKLELIGISIHYEGLSCADVLIANKGAVRLFQCKIIGGKRTERRGNGCGGDGIWLYDTAKGEVESCIFYKNAYGTTISGRAKLIINSCVFLENDRFGVYCFGDSHAYIQNSFFVRNGIDGTNNWGNSSIVVVNCEELGTRTNHTPLTIAIAIIIVLSIAIYHLISSSM